MSIEEERELDRRINSFWDRKVKQFPELDTDTCTDYENYHISITPKFFRQTKELIKYY